MLLLIFRQLTLCMLGNFVCFFCSLLIFFKISFFEKNLSGIASVSNSLDPDQARVIVKPDLGQICSQRLSAADTSRQRVKFNKTEACFSYVLEFKHTMFHTVPVLALDEGNSVHNFKKIDSFARKENLTLWVILCILELPQ